MKEVDPVEELHKIRKAICKEAGGTPAAYAQYYYEMSQKRLAALAKPTVKATVRNPGKRRRKVVAV